MTGPCVSAGTVVPEETGIFQLALAQAGLARLLVNDEVVLDGFTNRPPPGGNDFFGQASQDLVADVHFEQGVPVDMVVEYACDETSLAGFRVGFRTPDSDALLERAVTAAAAADVAIVCVGTTAETETEGRDRATMVAPGTPGRVGAARGRRQQPHCRRGQCRGTRRDGVGGGRGRRAAVLVRWPGDGRGAGGRARRRGRARRAAAHHAPDAPGARPSHANFPGENGELRYGEGLFMGYRGYEHSAIAPRFAFGHGLSYSSFDLGEPTLSALTHRTGGTVSVSVPVTNVGSRAGSEVVQCYVGPESPRLARPPKELKAFGKVSLEPGETAIVEFVLDDRAFAYWDPGQDDWNDVQAFVPEMFVFSLLRQPRRTRGWQVDAGSYEILIGRSSADIAHSRTIQVPDLVSGS